MSYPPHKGTHIYDETRNKIIESNIGIQGVTKGTHWYNNGNASVRAIECPEGFIHGRLKRKDK